MLKDHVLASYVSQASTVNGYVKKPYKQFDRFLLELTRSCCHAHSSGLGFKTDAFSAVRFSERQS